MHNNQAPGTSKSRYQDYRNGIKHKDETTKSELTEYYEFLPPRKRSKQPHYSRLIAIIITLLLVGGLLEFGHQVNELNDTQRQNDTMLDKIIKNQGVQIAQAKVPKQIRPQVIKVIQTTSLSQIQQAADNKHMFDKIATQNQISQKDINKARQAWFKQDNQPVRNLINQGDVFKALEVLKYE